MSSAIVATDDDDVDPTGWMPSPTELRAEQMVLGAMLLPIHVGSGPSNSLAIDRVLRIITPEHLFREPHRGIMRTIVEMDRDGRLVDTVTLANELESRSLLARVGGPSYLHTLMSLAPTPGGAAFHADIVKSAATRRATIEFAKHLQQVSRPGIDTETLLRAVADAHTAYLDTVDGQERTELRPAGHAPEITALLETWGDAPEGALTTGISDLDEVLNVGTGSLAIVAARSGTGKSTLMQTIVRHYALPSGRSEPVLVWSGEMPRDQLQTRDLAAMANVRTDSRTGKTDLDEFSRRRLQLKAAEYGEAEHYYIDDNPHATIDHILARTRDVYRRCGRIGLIAVDYAGLVDLPKRDREDQALGDLSRALKLAAKQYDCIALLVCQLNRKADDRSDGRPRMSDLRDSGRLEQDADLILLLHDPAPWDETRLGEMDIIIAKQRGGITGRTITAVDRRAFGAIADIAVP